MGRGGKNSDRRLQVHRLPAGACGLFSGSAAPVSVSELPLHASPPRWTVSRENINKSGRAPSMLTAYNQGRFLIPANSLFDHEQG